MSFITAPGATLLALAKLADISKVFFAKASLPLFSCFILLKSLAPSEADTPYDLDNLATAKIAVEVISETSPISVASAPAASADFFNPIPRARPFNEA